MAARPEDQYRARYQARQPGGPSVVGGPHAPEVFSASSVGRVISGVAGMAFVVFLACAAFALASLTGPLALVWVVGSVIIALVVATSVVSAHAGGHAWFVPIPGAVLALVWLLAAPGGSRHASAWWLLAGSAAFSGFAVLLAAGALRARFASPSMPVATLVGAEGTVTRALAPMGIVRVQGESWTAESMSGPLPVGVTVHVVRVEGLRLVVWSEQGRVLGLDLPEPFDNE